MLWFLLAAQFAVPAAHDSLAVLDAAKSAQHDFEWFRTHHLPWSKGGVRWGSCDERVGRFCFCYADDSSWRPPPEPQAIHEARDRLVGTLDSMAVLLPGDGWIAGQRIRYLVEASHAEAAILAAWECRAEPWWCDALAGYAFNAAHRFAPADSAFTAALDAMPEEQRCRWTDLRPLLTDLAGRYRKLPCAERDTLAERFWWLADPLYMVPGNERRTEHYARRVMNALQNDAFERERPASFDPMSFDPAIIGHNDPRSWYFLPPARFVTSPDAIREGSWNLEPARPISSYTPPYAVAFHELPHQIAVFRRGDSIAVVAGYDVRAPEDSLTRNTKIRHVEAALVLQPGPRRRRIIVRATGTAPDGVLLALAPAEPTLLSLEALDRADSTHASRERYWLAVVRRASGIALSDPLLFNVEQPDSLPQSLPDVVASTLGTARVIQGGRVGVFWETYGLADRREGFRTTLTLTRTGKSFLRRAAEWAGLASHNDHYVSLSWEELPQPGVTVYPHALSLAVPDAPPGRYVLEITLNMPGEPAAHTSRTLVVTPY
jgi:hypothetical protein